MSVDYMNMHPSELQEACNSHPDYSEYQKEAQKRREECAKELGITVEELLKRGNDSLYELGRNCIITERK